MARAAAILEARHRTRPGRLRRPIPNASCTGRRGSNGFRTPCGSIRRRHRPARLPPGTTIVTPRTTHSMGGFSGRGTIVDESPLRGHARPGGASVNAKRGCLTGVDTARQVVRLWATTVESGARSSLQGRWGGVRLGPVSRGEPLIRHCSQWRSLTEFARSHLF